MNEGLKVTVLLDNLAHGLGIVSHAVAGNTTLPILETVLISTFEGRLELRSSNSEISIITWIGARIDQEGATAVPAKVFQELVSQLPDPQVELSLNVRTQTLTIKSGGSKNNVKCFDAQEFPPKTVDALPQLLTGIPVTLEAARLKTMINQVSFAVSKEIGRGTLCAVNVEVEAAQITLAAADGFRLAVSKTAVEDRAGTPASAIVPVKALSVLSKIITEGEKVDMLMLKAGNQVAFRSKDIELCTQLVSGNFPDYKQIIPRTHKTRTSVPTSAILSAVRRAEIFSTSHVTRLTIKPGESLTPGELEVFATSDEIGSTTTNLEASVNGDALFIGFNTRYLRDAIEAIDEPNMVIETSISTSPGVFMPIGDDNFLQVIMPIALGDIEPAGETVEVVE